MISNNKGFSLVEVIIASGLIGGLAIAFLNFYDTSEKNNASFEANMKITRLVRSVTNQILTDEEGLPKIDLDAIASQITKPKNLFEDPRVGRTKCYSKDSNLVLINDPKCFYKFYYYIVAEKDKRFNPSSDLAKIPVIRAYFKVVYKDEKSKINKEITFDRIKTITLTR